MPKVRTIPATLSPITSAPLTAKKKRRVAGYARVSTDQEEQANSYQAQIDYYTNYIKCHEDWVLVKVFTDEGISGTSTARREGFKEMIDSALAGKIDLIITKSVSRFARNTVDSLVSIRALKEKGVEVFFEKENIWTFDGKGELLLTIMSSLAQEESRSISENVTWGKRKSFKDGKVEIPYSSFLGYEKGPDGRPAINEEQAKVVRLIYNRFLAGYSCRSIGNLLMKMNIKTPCGKTKWTSVLINRILRNEKYTGDALLQKTFSIDFLSKKRLKNEGQVPQYYVENSHPAIISKEQFELVQEEMKRRKEEGYRHAETLFSGHIICGECGSSFGSKLWHSTDKYRKVVWQCNGKYASDDICKSPHVTETQLKEAFTSAVNMLLSGHADHIKELQDIISNALCVESQEKELEDKKAEMEAVRLMVTKMYEDASTAPIDKDREDSLKKRYQKIDSRINELDAVIKDKRTRATKIRKFIGNLTSAEPQVKDFDIGLWETLGDRFIINVDRTITVVFKDESKIRVQYHK
jgi:DNA invertase Pin-like site-specific DNA recombinase